MTDLTPREIVSELDRFIIGQKDAKRAVAVALRNRWRRKQLPDDIREEVYPKNILMIGPTGVGKTEISRRLAKLAKAPFLKVEATKFTEVGYVGRDVDSIVRDLVDVAISDTRARMRDDVKAKAQKSAENRVIEAVAGKDARDQTRGRGKRSLRQRELRISDRCNVRKAPVFLARRRVADLREALRGLVAAFPHPRRCCLGHGSHHLRAPAAAGSTQP